MQGRLRSKKAAYKFILEKNNIGIVPLDEQEELCPVQRQSNHSV